jgi:hypothetical protein
MTDSSPVTSEVSLEDVARIIDPACAWNGYGWMSGVEEREDDARAKAHALRRAELIAALYAPVIAERDEALARVREVEGERKLWSAAEKDLIDQKWRAQHYIDRAQAAEARAEALQAQVEGARKALEPWSRGWLPGASRTVAIAIRQALSTLSGDAA